MNKKFLSLALAGLMTVSSFGATVYAAPKKDEKAKVSLFEQYNPNVAHAFSNAAKANKGDKALTQKQKEFVSLAIGIAVKCEACTKTHAKKAVEAGATMEELAELVGTCVMMGGGPSTAFGRLALETAKAAGAKDAEKKIELKEITEFVGELSDEYDVDALLKEHIPEFAKKYSLIGMNVMRDGYLTIKEKEMISVAIAMSVRCEACMNYHGAQCAKAGVTEAEFADIIACTYIMNGGPSSPASVTALAAYRKGQEEVKKEAEKKAAKENKAEVKTEVKTDKKVK